MSNSFATPWIVAHQAPLSVGVPRWEYYSGLPFPSPEDLPDPGIERVSPALTGKFFTPEPIGLVLTINCNRKTFKDDLASLVFFDLQCSLSVLPKIPMDKETLQMTILPGDSYEKKIVSSVCTMKQWSHNLIRVWVHSLFLTWDKNRWNIMSHVKVLEKAEWVKSDT